MHLIFGPNTNRIHEVVLLGILGAVDHVVKAVLEKHGLQMACLIHLFQNCF